MDSERSDAFVFFGATGDLAFKQIFPAYTASSETTTSTFPIIGVARSGDLGTLRERARLSIADRSPLYPYEPGSWGPVEADRLVREGERWHEPRRAP